MSIREQLEAHAERNRQEMASGRARTPWSGGSLECADLMGADLEFACLTGANLTRADFTNADIYRANLYRANLTGAELGGAELGGADLMSADLTGADLEGANLAGSNLYRADLTGADLTGADLTGADIEGADLTGATLMGATGLRSPDMPDPSELRRRVAEHIATHPEMHDQKRWGDGSADPACQTPCCVAGWACHLGGGDYGLLVPTAAMILLHVDGQPMPSFDADTTREKILAALRGES